MFLYAIEEFFSCEEQLACRQVWLDYFDTKENFRCGILRQDLSQKVQTIGWNILYVRSYTMSILLHI